MQLARHPIGLHPVSSGRHPPVAREHRSDPRNEVIGRADAPQSRVERRVRHAVECRRRIQICHMQLMAVGERVLVHPVDQGERFDAAAVDDEPVLRQVEQAPLVQHCQQPA